MTTIRDELQPWSGKEPTERLLTVLGIDPDLPAEWATVDRCEDWLSDRVRYTMPVRSAKDHRAVEWRDDAAGELHVHHAPTRHAALIAACKAVQEARP